MQSIKRCLISILLLACAASAVAVEIDGRIDAQEWQGAQHITDFRKTQPLNGEPASLATVVTISALATGIAVLPLPMNG